MPEPSSLNVRQIGDVTLIGFREASMLDVITIQRVSRELYAVVESGESQKIVLDFTHVRFLSSQALGVLLTLRRKAGGSTVLLCAIRPELARVFKITNLDKMFAFFDTPQAALEHLGQSLPAEESSS